MDKRIRLFRDQLYRPDNGTSQIDEKGRDHNGSQQSSQQDHIDHVFRTRSLQRFHRQFHSDDGHNFSC